MQSVGEILALMFGTQIREKAWSKLELRPPVVSLDRSRVR